MRQECRQVAGNDELLTKEIKLAVRPTGRRDISTSNQEWHTANCITQA